MPFALKRGLALALVAGAFGLALVPPRFAPDTPLWRSLSDAAHLPLFGGITVLLFHSLVSARRGEALRCAVAAGAAFALALAVELLQPVVSRTQSLDDLLVGASGIGAAASGIFVWRRAGAAGWRALHALLSVALGVIVLLPAWRELEAERWRTSHLPLLADFEDPTELHLWRPLGRGAERTDVAVTEARATEGRRSLEVRPRLGTWSGVEYAAGDADWTGYSALRFDVYAGEPGLRLNLRIDDTADCTEYASRFNRSFALEAGWNRVRVALEEIRRGPRDRALDTAAIRRLLIFLPRDATSGAFCLDAVRLE